MPEIDDVIFTPEVVCQTSRYVDKFSIGCAKTTRRVYAREQDCNMETMSKASGVY